MGFLSDIFSRAGRVARGQANEGMSSIEDATFDATVRQTVADMKTELNKAVNASAVAMSNYNRLDAEYQKYVRQSQEWKDRAGVGSADNAFAALNRFEETVAKEEASAQAFNQLAAAGKDDDLEKEFAALQGRSVDDDLAALKRERQLKPPTIPVALPAPSKTSGQAGGQ